MNEWLMYIYYRIQTYIEDAIEYGFATDVPLIWSFVGSIVGSALATAKDHMPSLGDFRECFLSAAKDDAVSAELLAHTLMQVVRLYSIYIC